MIPEVAQLGLYLILFLASVFYTSGWSDKPKSKSSNSRDEDDYDDLGVPQFSGELGRIARIGKTDPRYALVLNASQIRSHPNHKAAKQELAGIRRNKAEAWLEEL